jgi:hypothetical protein
MIASIILAAGLTCTATPITQSEAQAVALLVGKAEAVRGTEIAAEPSQPTGKAEDWTFWVVAPKSPSPSILVAWVSVGKLSVEISDPVTPDIPLKESAAVKKEQRRLRKLH